MDAQIQVLTARVARQGERIAQLERRLNRSSRNSSTPPSADPPAAAPKRGKDSSGRKQGAQPGHEGGGRPLLPEWAVDRMIEYWPERCGCGHVFVVDEHVAVGEPVRWQVEELPVTPTGRPYSTRSHGATWFVQTVIVGEPLFEQGFARAVVAQR